MLYCNSDYDRYIIDKYYDHLKDLTPTERMVEKFRLQLENIPIHIYKDDYFVGWFGFDEKLPTDGLRSYGYSLTDEEKALLDFPGTIGSSTMVDKSHTCADYGRILREGLVSFEKRIQAELKLCPDDAELLAMEKCVQVVRGFGKRIGTVIGNMLDGADDTKRQRLIDMKERAEKVPYYPAESFAEALQAVWIIHFLIPMAENGWYSISLGHFDRYMYPYYKKELESGTPKQTIVDMLHQFYRLLNNYSDGACLLGIGGEEYNDLSELLIECQKNFNLPAPILGARITEHTNDRIFDLLIDEKLFAAGQPTFYSEEGCREALKEKGIPDSDAVNFSNNSCMGIGIPGKEVNSMWGCVFNVSSSVELAVTGGKLVSKTGDTNIAPAGSFEELFGRFTAYCTENIAKCLKAFNLRSGLTEKYDPDVFFSVITDDCIERHRDRMSGARYQNATVECMGMVNASDALCAIDTLVFKEKRYTLNELTKAVKSNFAGYEQIRADILKCPKYGTNSEADEYAVRVADVLADIIPTHDHDNIHFVPSLHTIDTNVGYGAGWGAGFDGRLAGTPFAKNAGPCNEVRCNVPTSLVLSAAKLPQYRFYGGQPIDIHFDMSVVRDHKKAIAALIKTYFRNGGLQFQVNSVSVEILEDALEHPENHNDLIVRIGGFSDYFNRLNMATRLEFIERFSAEGRKPDKETEK